MSNIFSQSKTGIQVKQSIYAKSFTIASISFLLICLIGGLTSIIVDRGGILKGLTDLNSYDFDKLFSKEAAGAILMLQRVMIGSFALIMLSSVLNIVWVFKIQTASRKFIYSTFTIYIVAQGLGFGLLFTIMKANDLFIIFGVSGGLFAAMALLGHFAKDLSGMLPFLITGTMFILGATVIMMILYFVGVFSESFYFLIVIGTGVLALLWTMYDVWHIKRTSQWAEQHGMDKEMEFRFTMWFGFRLVSDLVAIVWTVARLYMRFKK